jgi:hypothetical protein
MIRTQVYLEESASKALRSLAVQTGKKQSELIRIAIEMLIAKHRKSDPQEKLKIAKGLWKDRNDLPDIEKFRLEWDR